MTAAWVLFSLIALGTGIWLFRPWRWTAFRALVRHPPLPAYEPPWWWLARLMRFGYLVWRVVITVMLAYMSALVAIGVDDKTKSKDVQRWVDGGWLLAAQLVGFVLLGFVIDITLHVWRITNEPEWPHYRRSLIDLSVPAIFCALMLCASWWAIVAA